ncbi:MAG: cytochrome c [Wenzhouxiangellaceae bacterium]
MRRIPTVCATVCETVCAAVRAIAPAIVVAIVVASFAIGPLDAAAQGDPERGKVIAYTCTGCHGIPFYKNVYPTYTVPKLGGQNQEYLITALEAYRSGERRHATMQAQAATLSDQDILDVTAYFVSIGEKES